MELTAQQIAVLRCIGQGMTNAETAAHLYLAVNTVKIHRRNAYERAMQDRDEWENHRAWEMRVCAALAQGEDIRITAIQTREYTRGFVDGEKHGREQERILIVRALERIGQDARVGASPAWRTA